MIVGSVALLGATLLAGTAPRGPAHAHANTHVQAQVPCEQDPYLDDGVVRVGVDPEAGGAISWLGPSGTGENLVNTFDLGRYIQQSYYSGPTPFLPTGALANPGWPSWPWNPIQAGDSFGNRASVTAMANDGTTLYVAAVPLHWALDGVAGEATMEQWITLDPSTPGVVHVANLLRNRRTDGTDQHPGRDQELPAVYTNDPYVRVVTYTGDAPFTGAPVEEIDTAVPPGETFPWKRWRATEGWSALVDDSMQGLGVVHPGVVSTLGGQAGQALGPPFHTGYLSPIRQEIIDHDIVYAYRYDLVLGDVDDIRAHATAHRVDPWPEYVFAHDRQHVVYRGAVDDGLPVGGSLDVVATSLDPQIIGPAGHWDAAAVPRLFIRAGFTTTDDEAVVLFADDTGAFDGARAVPFAVIGDGVVRTYEVDLAGHPDYVGTIGGIRLDPAVVAAAGDRVELHWISYRDEPDVPSAAATLAVPDPGLCPSTTTTSTATESPDDPVVVPVVVTPRFTG